MCGIVGYVGPQQATPFLLDGLRRLEYRGYDSAGLAVHDGTGVRTRRAAGKLANLSGVEQKSPLSGSLGIGHIRWATHGRPNEQNAHPHLVDGVAVVHNGIIENHLALREELEARGVRFASDTDTEIIAHLISRAKQEGGGKTSLFAAVSASLARVRGAYAIAVVADDEPGELVVARQSSPLIVGIGEGETFCGSDITALLARTRDMVILEDGDVARLRAEGIYIEQAGEAVTRPVKRIDWSPTAAERGGYKHFMLKEIHEQPRVLEDTLRGRVDLPAGDVVPDEMGVSPEEARAIGRVYLVACGTSHHAAMAGRYWIEQLARVPCVVELASEVRYRQPVFTPTDLVIGVSQSGETLDTLEAVKHARAQGARILAVANVLDGAIPRAAHGALYTHAGPEIGVASTKCFTAQLAALFLFAVYLGRRRGTLDEGRARDLLQSLVETPQHLRRILAQAPYLAAIARKLYTAKNMLFLGRGLQFPVALEGALKLKEISYIHAEGYAAGEMKHGPIALVDEHMPLVVLCPKDGHYEKTLSNVQEVRARDGQVFAVATEGDEQAAAVATHLFLLPDVAHELLPLLAVVPLQLLAYYIADLKGTDVDQPRNLAKTVTVE